MAQMYRLFVYGTILDKGVRRRVARRSVEGTADALQGYRKTSVKLSENVYPNIEKDDNSTVEGEVLSIDNEELKRFDIYEGEEYNRITVALQSGREAYVYLVE